MTVLNFVRFRPKERRGRPAVELVQGMNPPDGKCRERDYINRTLEMSGGTALSSVRHAAPSSLSQKRDNAEAIMGPKTPDDSTGAAERRH
jgi:hypothetical protein